MGNGGSRAARSRSGCGLSLSLGRRGTISRRAENSPSGSRIASRAVRDFPALGGPTTRTKRCSPGPHAARGPGRAARMAPPRRSRRSARQWLTARCAARWDRPRWRSAASAPAPARCAQRAPGDPSTSSAGAAREPPPAASSASPATVHPLAPPLRIAVMAASAVSAATIAHGNARDHRDPRWDREPRRLSDSVTLTSESDTCQPSAANRSRLPKSTPTGDPSRPPDHDVREGQFPDMSEDCGTLCLGMANELGRIAGQVLGARRGGAPPRRLDRARGRDRRASALA